MQLRKRLSASLAELVVAQASLGGHRREQCGCEVGLSFRCSIESTFTGWVETRASPGHLRRCESRSRSHVWQARSRDSVPRQRQEELRTAEIRKFEVTSSSRPIQITATAAQEQPAQPDSFVSPQASLRPDSSQACQNVVIVGVESRPAKLH